MVMIDAGDPKMIRETLCVAQFEIQQTINVLATPPSSYEFAVDRIQKLIDQIDVLRPLGPDGKHGDRHTEQCGCDI